MDKTELFMKAIAVNLWLPKKWRKNSNNATNVQHIDITPLSHLSLKFVGDWNGLRLHQTQQLTISNLRLTKKHNESLSWHL